jgi:hypothetical protein
VPRLWTGQSSEAHCFPSGPAGLPPRWLLQLSWGASLIQGKRVVKRENSRVLFHRSVLLSVTKTPSGGPAEAPAGPHVGEPDPDDPIPPRQGPAAWPLKDRELMAEREGLNVQVSKQMEFLTGTAGSEGVQAKSGSRAWSWAALCTARSRLMFWRARSAGVDCG